MRERKSCNWIWRGDVLKSDLARNDAVVEDLELRNCVFFSCALDDAAFWILPQGLPSRSSPPPLAFDDKDKVQDLFGTLEGSRSVRGRVRI